MKTFTCLSGIADGIQLARTRRIYLEEQLGFPLAIGYQVSSMSINQGTQNPRQPRFADLKYLAKQTQDYGFLTSVHYYAKSEETTLSDLEKISESANGSLLQFNTLPPSREILGKAKSLGFQVIMKVAVSNKFSPDGGYKVWKGEQVEDVSVGNPLNLVKQITDRKDFLDYVMFDPSHGTNLGLDLSENSLAIRFGKLVTENPLLSNLGIIYAGGITPANAGETISKLEKYFPRRTCIDIESGIRTQNQISFESVREYLRSVSDAKLI